MSFLVDAQYNRFNFVTKSQHLAWVRKTLRPTHLADMSKTFDPFFNTNKNTVVHNVHYGSLYSCVDRVTLFDILPGTGRLLFKTQRNLLLVPVHRNNDTLDLLLKIEYFRRMRYPAPTQI